MQGQTLGAVTGLYSLVVGFAIGLLVMIVVSLATRKPSDEILEEFDAVRKMKTLGDEEVVSAKAE